MRPELFHDRAGGLVDPYRVARRRAGGGSHRFGVEHGGPAPRERGEGLFYLDPALPDRLLDRRCGQGQAAVLERRAQQQRVHRHVVGEQPLGQFLGVQGVRGAGAGRDAGDQAARVGWCHGAVDDLGGGERRA
jgi:hypothetical protein